MSFWPRLSARAVVAQVGSLPYIVLETDGNYQVWRVLSGTPTRLTDYPVGSNFSDQQENPRLSPDGSMVAYEMQFYDPYADDFTGGIWIVSATAGGAVSTRITPDDLSGDWFLNPSWHPDNDKLLYTHGHTVGAFAGAIKRVSVSSPGSATTLWTPIHAREATHRPKYNHDGTLIAFIVNNEGGLGGEDFTRQGLWVMNADGSSPTHIEGSLFGNVQNAAYSFDQSQLEWANASNQIAFSCKGFGTGQGDIYVINSDGSGLTKVSTGASDAFECRIGHGAWLEDDSGIIISAFDTGDSAWRIRQLAPDGSSDVELNGSVGPGGGTQYIHCAFRNPQDNRIYFIEDNNPGILSSVAIDGTDYRVDDALATTGAGDQFYTGSGIEWI